MERASSDFVSIPIRFIKTKECHYEKHKENIDKIMLKYISDQIRRDSVEVRQTELLKYFLFEITND